MSRACQGLSREKMKTFKEFITEEVPANATGSAVAGTTGEPPVGRKKKKPIVMRRFASQDVFEVDSDTYSKCLTGKKKYDKYENYVGKDDVGQAIRSYGRDRKNSKKSILVQNASTGVMTYLKRGK